LARSEDACRWQGPQIRALAHLLVAESAQALQDRAARDEHLRMHWSMRRRPVDQQCPAGHTRGCVVACGPLGAGRPRPAGCAIQWLASLPQGAARRTHGIAHQAQGGTPGAQDHRRAGHRAAAGQAPGFSPLAAQSILRGLAVDLLNGAHDTAQLRRAWDSLEAHERLIPELAIHAAQRLTLLGATWPWHVPGCCPCGSSGGSWAISPRRLVRALEAGLSQIDGAWLARIEAAHQPNPRDTLLQYLAGMACLKRQLWGKAQQMLTQAALGLQDAGLHRNAWRGPGRSWPSSVASPKWPSRPTGGQPLPEPYR
jgi:HemY protein